MMSSHLRLPEVSYNGQPIASPANWTAKNYADGSFKFPIIRYSKEGSYVYQVSEQVPQGGKAYGITYDTTSYYVTIVVKDTGKGKLQVVSETYTLLNGTPTNALNFANDYVPEKTSVQFMGDKKLSLAKSTTPLRAANMSLNFMHLMKIG